MVSGSSAAPECDCLLEGLREPTGGYQVVQGSFLATRFTILYFHAGSSPAAIFDFSNLTIRFSTVFDLDLARPRTHVCLSRIMDAAEASCNS